MIAEAFLFIYNLSVIDLETSEISFLNVFTSFLTYNAQIQIKSSELKSSFL